MIEKPKTLILGATTNPNRYAYLAAEALHKKSFPFVLVGIKEGNVFEQPIQASIPEDEEIDTVTLYVGAKNQEDWQEKIKKLKPRRVIFNPGAENPPFAHELEQAGIEVLEACTLVMLSTNQY